VYGIIRQIHLYAGLALALVLFVFAVSGAMLVYKEAYWRAVYPELRGPGPELSAADHAQAVAVAQARFGKRLRNVKLPEPGVNAYHLYLTNGEAFLAVDDFRTLDAWRPTERLMAFLFDLHAHLLAGETGERVGGFIGLAGTLMALTGLILWWPARRRFRLANLWPRDLSRRTLLRWHRDLGLVVVPLLLLLLLTGSGIVFYETAGAILAGLTRDPTPPAERVLPAQGLGASTARGLPTAEAVARAMTAFPDSRLVFITPAAGPGAPVAFRIKQSCELHPNGRSFVYFEPGKRGALRRVDACAAGSGVGALHALYPLHAGKTGSALYKAAAFLASLVLAMLCVTGVVTYLRKLTRTPAAQNRSGQPTRN